jgi:hypothetical protein
VVATIASAEDYVVWAQAVGLTPLPSGLPAALQYGTEEVQRYCRRELLPSPADPSQTEVRDVYGDGGLTLFIPDAITVQEVRCQGALVPEDIAPGTLLPGYNRVRFGSDGPIVRLVFRPIIATAYSSAYQVPISYRGLYRWIPDMPYQVTGRFGYAEPTDLPGTVRRACCMLAALYLNQQNQWQAALSAARRVTAVSVTVDVDNTGQGLQSLRQQAYRLLDDYTRLF